MSKIKALMIAAGATLALLSVAAPAHAQATRTWVSGVGDDANPCSRTAPCKTFAGAISKTAVGGYINCLDPGGFGAVTITKAITIQCEEETGHVVVAGTNGIVVNVTAGTNVTLRGLTLEGAGAGLSGIRLIQSGNLHLQEVVITGFVNHGIDISPNAGGTQVHIVDTYITDNATTAAFAGINFTPSAGASIQAELNRVSIENNTNGINVDGTGGPINVSVRDSVVARGTGNGILGSSTASGVNVMIDRSTAASFNGTGVSANGAQATVRIGNSTVFANGTGVSATGGGNLRTYKTNQINGNTNDNTPIANQDQLQ
jgi:hypothetical protein